MRPERLRLLTRNRRMCRPLKPSQRLLHRQQRQAHKQAQRAEQEALEEADRARRWVEQIRLEMYLRP